jgi:hypothetical protein
MAATPVALHGWAEIIDGIKETERMLNKGTSVKDVKNRRWHRGILLRQRMGRMSTSSWAVADDEQDMFGMDAKSFIYKMGTQYWITEDFDIFAAIEMYENDIYVGIMEIKNACRRRLVP